MRVVRLTSIGALAAGVTAQSGSVFEPQDFNITAALEKLGVVVSILPEPASLLDARSSDAQCSHAVSATMAPVKMA
jgi:hypothetical protein